MHLFTLFYFMLGLFDFYFIFILTNYVYTPNTYMHAHTHTLTHSHIRTCHALHHTHTPNDTLSFISHIQNNRLVNGCISEELKDIHAFSQKTFTPSQWQEAAAEETK